MANIVGEPFDKFVSKQIIDRQRIHGTSNRNNSILSYLNSKTSWIKLTSGVKILDYERLKRINLGDHPSFTDTGLAERFILFNGVSDKDNTLFGGINGINPNEPNQNVGQSILNKHAYGIGGNEFGIRPMPGIKSCDIKSRNRGSIRESTIQIKVWNRNQFEIINLLYLRLGFPMLLEWGHSIIVDTNGDIDSNPNFSLSNNFLSKKYKTDNDVLKDLTTQREKSAGNYDGMYGKVVNFDWTFNKDGSYDVTLKLISIGAVIESLKINTYLKDLSISTPVNSDTNDDNPESDEEWINKFKFSHSLGYIFWGAMYALNDFFVGKNDSFNTDKIDGINKNELKSILQLPSDFTPDTVLTKSQNENVNNYINSINTPTSDKDYILYGLDGFDELFYIRFGELLRLIQILIPVNKETTPPTPILNIDTTSIFMYTTSYQISGNPRVCLVGGFDIPNGSSTTSFLNDDSTLKTNPYKYILNNNVLHGNINNIYVNMAFVLQTLENFKDENGKVTILDMLKSILDGINESLGSINNLECIISNDNVLRIIDNTPIPGLNSAFPTNPDEESAQFDIYGYYNYENPNQHAGFIKDFQLKTEITNNLAATLVIGATANGKVVGEDATAFSKWNKGLYPIINSNITAATEEPTPTPKQSDINKLIKDNEQLEKDFRDFIKESINFNLSAELMDGGSQLVANYLAYLNELSLLQEKINNPDKSPVSATSSRGFFPINLSLTMDGLSGMKTYQKIKVDTSYLPSDYPAALNFIIKGVSHKIDRNGWLTTVDTVSVPIIDLVEYTGATSPSQAATVTQAAILASSSSTAKNASRNNPNANKLRNTLTQLGYREKGSEIDSGGQDISSNIEKVTSSILKTIKQELPNVIITITGGNDRYHQTLSYTSRHSSGNALDLSVSPSDSKTLDKIVNILQRYAAGNNPNFRFIDEYRHLTKAGTGNHFHISWGAGTESQNELNKSLLLAQQGKIKPIKIA